MRIRFVPVSLMLAPLFITPSLVAQSEGLPYTRGSVWAISMVRTTAGFNDDYLRSLATTWRRANEEAKKQGLILSYKILSSNSTGPDDWNLLLMVELKNWAALDGLDEKLEAIQRKVIGDQSAQRELATKRLEIRRIVATKNAQELFLK